MPNKLIHWEPFREIDTLQRQMNHLFDTLLYPVENNQAHFGYFPLAEITETPEEVNLKLEVPGLEAKDFQVEVTADSVEISGERKSETKTQNHGQTRTEFRYGKFHRSITLPVRIDNTKVKANYQDGILTLTLPKAEEEKHKVVKVNVS